MLIEAVKVHPSWNKFITPSILSELIRIEQKIGAEYTPPMGKILRFLELDLNNIKVVILGQDPYPTAGAANGRAFQPNDLEDWTQSFKQVSLKNIIRNIYASVNGTSIYDLIPSYSEIKDKINNGTFNIKSPKEWFDSLENQGVLLLNTSLTCQIGESNSHKDIWATFTHKLIKFVSMERASSKWFMWGKEAIAYSETISSGTHYKSRHPMMCSKSYEDDFLRNKCFKDTIEIINWLG